MPDAVIEKSLGLSTSLSEHIDQTLVDGSMSRATLSKFQELLEYRRPMETVDLPSQSQLVPLESENGQSSMEITDSSAVDPDVNPISHPTNLTDENAHQLPNRSSPSSEDD